MPNSSKKKIVLLGVNSKYSHTSLGLRYLLANLKELQEDTSLLEFTINENIQDICEKIIEYQPEILALGVYIWNVLNISQIIEIIKKILPNTQIILGGPEVSHTPFRVKLKDADFIIQGEGEVTFYELCRDIISKTPPLTKIIKAKTVDVSKINLPYELYSDFDLKHRYTYVEASRGCPYECEFCLSSMDKKVRYFDIDIFIDQMEKLWQRGCRNFKFIDRTFNLNITAANKLMDFFLSKKEQYFLHFEVVPDNFPASLKERLKEFPAFSLQLEIGIQTLNPKIALNINRNLDIPKIEQNLAFLQAHTKAHMHLDLIVGLPGESLESFGANLDKLVSISDCEIQIGILKKLSGTSISRHDKVYEMIYSDTPPYDILQNRYISYLEVQKMKRFARFWDLTYNSGNFYHTIKELFIDGKVYENFYNFSDWIYHQTYSTWQISLNRLSELLFIYLTDILKKDKTKIADLLIKDIARVDGRSIAEFLREHASYIPDLRAKSISKEQKRQQLREQQ